MKWYIWVHGYTRDSVHPKPELKEVEAKVKGLFGVQETGGWSEYLPFKKCTEFMLAASEYMYELKVTNILIQQEPDENFLAKGTVER